MYILDYAIPDRPRHIELVGVSFAEGGWEANLLMTQTATTPAMQARMVQPLIGFEPGEEPISAAANWLAGEDGPFAGAVVVEPGDYAFTARRLDMQVAVKAKRDAVRDGGCVTPLGRVDTDTRSELNILGALQTASIVGSSYTVAWRMADNTAVTHSVAQLVALGMAVGGFVAACQARKNELDAEIEAATTEADLDEIDINAGWPT